jgi:hypothetical protein
MQTRCDLRGTGKSTCAPQRMLWDDLPFVVKRLITVLHFWKRAKEMWAQEVFEERMPVLIS